jgi:hypothetical protein
LPVIASDWAGLREVVSDDVNGYLIPTCWVPGSSRVSAFSPVSQENIDSLLLSQCVVVDQEHLSGRLGRLFRDPHLRATFGAAAIATARAHRQSVIRERILTLFGEQLQAAASEPTTARAIRRQNAELLVERFARNLHPHRDSCLTQ